MHTRDGVSTRLSQERLAQQPREVFGAHTSERRAAGAVDRAGGVAVGALIPRVLMRAIRHDRPAAHPPPLGATTNLLCTAPAAPAQQPQPGDQNGPPGSEFGPQTDS
jgi:hypothetical protein